MDRPRRRVTAEPFAVTLIFACVIATLATVIAVHRRKPTPRPLPVVAAPAAVEVKVVEAKTSKPLPTPPPPKPAPAPEDPTKAIVAELARAESEQRLEAVRADRQVAALAAATRTAKAESDRSKRGMSLTKAQLDARAADAGRRESQVELAGMERDALARRRDMLKKTLESDRARPSYAVLPHKGPNGTWQRPIVLECKDEAVSLRPNGPTFGILDLGPSLGGRIGSFAAAISREAIRIQRQSAPDGAEITPYIFFIIRPDGIQAYYEARTRLERLGIAFGYELADPDWAIDVPDLDQPSTWDGSPPPISGHDDSASNLATQGSGDGPGTGRAGRDEIDRAFTWPKTPPGMDEGGSGQGHSASMLGAPLDRLVPGDDAGGGTGDGTAPGGSRGLAQGGTGPAQGGTGRGLSEEVWKRAVGMNGPGRPAGLSQGGNGPGGTGTDGSPSGTGETGTEGLTGARPGFPKRPIGVGRGPKALASTGGLDGLLASLPRGDGPGGDPNATKGDSSIRPGGLGQGSGSESGSSGTSSGRAGLQAARQPLGNGSGSGSGEEASGGNGSSGPRQAGQSGGGSPGSGGSEGSGSPGQSGGSSGGQGSPGGGSGGTPSRFGSPSMPSRPMELVVACSPKGVSVHPGNYRVTAATLKSKDELLVGQLRAIVVQKERAEPGSTIAPSIRFIIEAGGHETYATAKAQVMFAGLDWPTSLQVSGGDTLRLFSTDAWK